jgi:hypothetical protein
MVIEVKIAGSGSIISTPGIWRTPCRVDVMATATMTAGNLAASLVRLRPMVIPTVSAAKPGTVRPHKQSARRQPIGKRERERERMEAHVNHRQGVYQEMEEK